MTDEVAYFGGPYFGGPYFVVCVPVPISGPPGRRVGRPKQWHKYEKKHKLTGHVAQKYELHQMLQAVVAQKFEQSFPIEVLVGKLKPYSVTFPVKVMVRDDMDDYMLYLLMLEYLD
jgi:hypothetical protein